MPSQDSGALGRWCRLTCRLRLFPGLTAPLTASGQDCLSHQTSWAVVLIWKVSLVSLVNRNRLEATQKVRQGFTGGPAASGSGPLAPHPLGWGAVPPVGWGEGVRVVRAQVACLPLQCCVQGACSVPCFCSQPLQKWQLSFLVL